MNHVHTAAAALQEANHVHVLCVHVCVRQRNERQAMKMMKGESLKAYNRRLRRMTDTKLQQVDKTMPLRKVNEKRKR